MQQLRQLSGVQLPWRRGLSGERDTDNPIACEAPHVRLRQTLSRYQLALIGICECGPRAGVGRLLRVAGRVEHHEMRGVPCFGLQLACNRDRRRDADIATAARGPRDRISCQMEKRTR
jgi:hypothetical protein